MLDLVAQFMENASKQPAHPAVVEDTGSVTYEELARMVSRIAAAIAVVCEQPRVLIYLPKGAAAYAAMLATMKAGGVYAPVNLDAPVHRNVEILKQFRPHVIVSTTATLEILETAGKGSTLVDIDNLTAEELDDPRPGSKLAYVMFTSGTTGKPKGVMIPHTALASYTEWALAAMSPSPEDKWSQHPNIAFDISALDIYGALCSGATLYPVISAKDKLLPAQFIRRHQLTIWTSVPSIVDLMVKARQATTQNFASLRLLSFCGEPLFQKHLDAVFDANESVVVHNTYGPTEATISCTLLRMTKSTYRQYCNNSVAIGQPIQGMDFVFDGGSDEEGELLLLGRQLAVGYWENAAETEQVFMSISVEGDVRRAYRTGDWVAKRSGEYFFVSRIDSQVKIRGNRVELDGIDSAIFELGFGNSCTVHVNDELHSFLETEHLPDLVQFRQTLSNRLLEYELPAHIYAIEFLPRSANDKIDRNQLAERVKEMWYDTSEV